LQSPLLQVSPAAIGRAAGLRREVATVAVDRV
jgi:hypothetical protein